MNRALLLLALIAAPTFAQVAAREISTKEAHAISGNASPTIKQMKSPLLLDVPFKTAKGGSVLEVFRLGSQVWRTEETAQYVCDKAHVLGIEVTQEKAKKGRMKLRIKTPVATSWFRQDVNYTLEFRVGAESVKSQTWRSLTIGAPAGGLVWGGSSTKVPTIEIDQTLDEWKAIEAKGEPAIRIVLEVDEDDD